MIEFLGLLYVLGKDLVKFLSFREEEKLVDAEWLEKSGFGDEITQKGYDLRWSTPEKVETRKLNGWEIIYEVDRIKRIRRKLIRGGELLLLGKKQGHKK